MSKICTPHHDWLTASLSILLCSGLIISYMPQHLRIILAKSSEGFSPWFLLLGSTSCASGMLNLFVMQWEIIRCCRYLSAGACLESVGGVIQTFLQWFLFTIILVLYMIYYPQHLKYTAVDVDGESTGSRQHLKATNVKSDSWRLSITLSWAVFIHIIFVTSVTFFLLVTRPPSPEPMLTRQLNSWATFLGVTSAGLAALQYAPQIVHTYRMKLVGALSIPMMLIQTPGAIFMVLSIALRPGTNWTSWITYAVAGMMQGTLLSMCIVWKFRQSKMGVDDFGKPFVVEGASIESQSTDELSPPSEGTPLITPTNAVSKRGLGWKRILNWL